MSRLAAGKLGGVAFAGMLRSPAAVRERRLIERTSRLASTDVEGWAQARAGRLLERGRRSLPAYRDYPDFRDAPVLSKNQVAVDPEAFTNRHIPARNVTTGGTGGRPLTVRVSLSSFITEWVYIEHAWRTAGVSVRDPKITFRGSSLGQGFSSKKVHFQPAYNHFLVSPFDLRDDVFRELLREIDGFKPVALWGYPSAIVSFAQWVMETGPHLALDSVRAVLLASEGAFDWQIALLTEVFAAKVVRWYGQSEKVVFAAGCEDSSSYHVLPSYGLAERFGEGLVGTGFTNRAMPLVRYDTEDRGALFPGPCPCGYPFQVLSEVKGRWDQSLFWGSSDEAISTTALNFHDPIFGRFAQFQFRQERRGLVELCVVARPGAGEQELSDAVQALQRRVGESLTLSGRLVGPGELLSQRGKAVLVDQRYAPTAVGESGSPIEND